MNLWRGVFLAFITVGILTAATEALADTALVLPKNVYYFQAKYYHYFPITERYNHDGDSEPLATDLSNKELNSVVFPPLAQLDPFVGGNASIGRSDVDFEYKINNFEFYFYYGLTDKLSLGVMIPYFFLRNDVDASVDTTTANVGKNPYLNTLAPLKVPGTTPLTTNDVQHLLGKGLDINGDGKIDIPGYGFKPIESWSDDGLGDMELLAKYQFFKNETWRFAFTGGLRLPTGQADDSDSLVDIGFGADTFSLLFRAFADYTGIKNLLLNGTIRYDLQLPSRQQLRVTDVNHPITADKESVWRNLGDILELEAFGNYSFTPEISAGLKYRYTRKFKDSVSGSGSADYSLLEDRTDYTSQMFFATLGFSTIQGYLDKRYSVPLSIDLEYRNRFAGTNYVNNSQYLLLSFTLLFK